jgi:mycothiol system anti-sigma-R factor
MADCTETLRELEAFLDDELTAETRVSIRSHLGDCLDCLQAFDFHAELRDVIAVKCRTDEMPASLMAKIELCFGVDLDAPDADGGFDTGSD